MKEAETFMDTAKPNRCFLVRRAGYRMDSVRHGDSDSTGKNARGLHMPLCKTNVLRREYDGQLNGADN